MPEIQSICIIRLSAIGDCINAFAAINAIRNVYPNAIITWIIGQTEASLFKEVKNIEFISYNKKNGFKEYLRLNKLLKDRKFDVLLDMQNALRASLVSLCVKAKYKYGFDATRSMDCQSLFTNKKIKSPSSPHVLDGFLAFAEEICHQKVEPIWDFNFTLDEISYAKSIISGDKNIILTPCSSKSYKNWGLHGYIEICKYAISKGFKIYICGGKSVLEKQTAEAIQQNVCTPEKLVDLTGTTSLRQMLALISRADFIISPDSGPIHMANAVKTPALGLYAHHNPQRVGPYNYLRYTVSVYDECIALEHKDPTKIKWRTRVKDKTAMLKISLEMVRKAFDEICNDLKLE